MRDSVLMQERAIPTSELTQPLLVRLLYETEPVLPPERLADEVDDDVKIEILAGDDDPELRFHTRVDGTSFSATLLPSGRVHRSELQSDLDQTFAWVDADEACRLAGEGVLLAEIGPESLPPLVRVEAFSGILRAVIGTTNPVATQWLRSSHLVSPADVCVDLFAGPVNVRMYGDAEADDAWLMDTMGLGALGLLDLQCHFRGLDPGLVAGWLQGVARSMIRDASVPEEGIGLEGVDGRPWHCRYEPSLAPPTRTVVDVDPGGAYSGGVREP